jgi:hypothetical protein
LGEGSRATVISMQLILLQVISQNAYLVTVCTILFATGLVSGVVTV